MQRNAVDKMFNILSFYLLCPSARRVLSLPLRSASFIMIMVRSICGALSWLLRRCWFLSTGYSICTGFSGNDFAAICAHVCMRVFLNAFSIRFGWRALFFHPSLRLLYSRNRWLQFINIIDRRKTFRIVVFSFNSVGFCRSENKEAATNIFDLMKRSFVDSGLLQSQFARNEKCILRNGFRGTDGWRRCLLSALPLASGSVFFFAAGGPARSLHIISMCFSRRRFSHSIVSGASERTRACVFVFTPLTRAPVVRYQPICLRFKHLFISFI